MNHQEAEEFIKQIEKANRHFKWALVGISLIAVGQILFLISTLMN